MTAESRGGRRRRGGGRPGQTSTPSSSARRRSCSSPYLRPDPEARGRHRQRDRGGVHPSGTWSRSYRTWGSASQFLAAQIEQAKSEVDAKEKELLAYGAPERHHLARLPEQPSRAEAELPEPTDYATATADRVDKEAHYEEVRNTRARALADIASEGAVSQQRAELQKMERDYAEKLNLFKPEWPAMQQLKAQIDKGRQHLEIADPGDRVEGERGGAHRVP